jgi:hypothetical protein
MLTYVGQKNGAVAILQALTENTTLKCLILSYNKLHSVINDTSLLVSNQLVSLCLEACGLTDSDCAVIADALKRNCTLIHLEMSFNFFQDTSGQSLGEALTCNTNLTALVISRNKLRNTGCVALVSRLCHNMTLTTLRLDDNDIGHEGAAGIAAMLRVNRTLTVLDVYDNDLLSDEDISSILNSVAHHPSMLAIMIENIEFRHRSIEAVSTVIRHNRDIQTIYCGPLFKDIVSDLTPDQCLEQYMHIYIAMRETPRYDDVIDFRGRDFQPHFPNPSSLAKKFGLPDGHVASLNITNLQEYFRDAHWHSILAFVMGTHVRLGRACIIRTLSEDAVAHIVAAFFGLSADDILVQE